MVVAGPTNTRCFLLDQALEMNDTFCAGTSGEGPRAREEEEEEEEEELELMAT